MLLDGVRNWFGTAPAMGSGGAPTPTPGDAGTADDASAALPPEGPWPAARIALSEQLWGEGFLFPGGEDETLRLVRPLGLTAAASLLLLGAASGGPPRAVAAQLGVWVTGFESDPDLAALAAERCTRARLGRRAQVEMWYPNNPAFNVQAYHHAVAIEPLRHGQPEPILAALTAALRPAGQLVIVDAVADEPLDPADPVVAAWCKAERRSADLPTELGVARALGRLGFDVRVAEDISARHIRLAVIGWKNMLKGVRDRPAPADAARMVAEAELWLLRLRLLREGRVRMLRWHAFSSRREPVGG